MRKKFFVVIPGANDSAQQFPMKDWLRQNPSYIPKGLHPGGSTSRQLLSAFKKTNWKYAEDDEYVKLTPPEYGAIPEPLTSVEASDDLPEYPEDLRFSLENQLRDFLEENLESIPIENQRLKVYIDPTGRDGVEYPTDVGPIDILAVNKNGDFYIFELKRGISSDKTVGQITRYMGWVKSTIGKDKNVFGVIVSKSTNEKLKYSKLMVPNILAYEYRLEIKLEKV